ncbi:PLP-dependent aminotransferase family protein [Streptomyces sp. NBC_01508]|uniref:MocR-like pyridoxine biosynthesis transcription factor PdxR n=1 Tax=Streptomyces sp. NBC_01508 TaxID=2903888 RepID=UPI003869F0A2
MHRPHSQPPSRSVTPRTEVYGADFLQLTVDDAPKGELSGWLAGQLRRAISDGRLPVGSRLPATRTLAAELHVSRGVVTEAYQRLTEDGHVAGHGRAGTTVVAAPVSVPERRAPVRQFGAPPTTTTGTAARTPFTDQPGPDVFDVVRATPARVDLSPGVPDLASFPRAAWLRAERAVLGTLAASDFGYGDPRGTPALRQAVANWLARNRGITVDPGRIVVVAGTAQTLGLLAQVLTRHGISDVAVEDPGSLGARQHLRHWGMRTPPVPVDADGIRVDALRADGAPAVLVTPAHQFPTGVVLGGERRRELMAWAQDGGLIIEDDYDAEHRYDRPPVAALRSMLAEHVCYAGSVSKLLAPALRVGWVVVPAEYHDALVDAKRFTDLGNAALPQLALAHLMESGELERLLRTLRRRHRARRDAMIAAVAEHLPGAVVRGAAAGLHLTVTFDAPTTGGGVTDPGITDTALATAALAHGVKVQPLSWHSQTPQPPGLVLGYAASTPTAIADGIAGIGRALRSVWGVL